MEPEQMHNAAPEQEQSSQEQTESAAQTETNSEYQSESELQESAEQSAPAPETGQETAAPDSSASEVAESEDGPHSNAMATPSGEQSESNTINQQSGSFLEGLDFEGKEFTSIHSDGTLALKATPFSSERTLQTLYPDSASATIAALVARFPEAQNKVRELGEEWAAAEDKGKLYSKLVRVRDYLLHANAIGDFTPLYQQVALWESTLGESEDKAFAERLSLVEKAEALNAEEPSKEATNALREIGEQWKKLPSMADKSRADALWERLEAARNTFHDRKRERQLSDQAEMANNYDIKKDLAEEAERLAATEDWKATTQAYNDLMDKWKSTGRTFNDKNEALWQRFITAKNVFYDRKRQHFQTIQTEQEENYTRKLALVEKAEAMSSSTDWNKTSNDYNDLMERWKGVGKVPIEKADELWDRLRAAKDVFYNARRQHQATEKVVHDDNYAQKSALVRRAEELQRSTAWGDTSAEFAELMEEWKKIGPVDHRRSQPLWEAFAKARRSFFERKDDYFDRRREQFQHAQTERAAQAKDFLVKLREELKEDEEALTDFHLSLNNLTGAGKKDAEIRANLERLIAQATPRIEKKRQKIAEVEAQAAQSARNEKREKKPEATVPATEAQNRKEQPQERIAADAPQDYATDTSGGDSGAEPKGVEGVE